MAVVNANGFRVLALNAATGTKLPIAEAISASLSFSNSLIPVTTKTSNAWAEKIPGEKSFTVTADGLMDYDTTTNETNAITLALWAGLGASGVIPTKVYFEIGIADQSYDGSGWISALEHSGGTNDAPTYSITIEGDGPMVYSAT